MLAFFHLDPPPRFPDHPALDLLDLLLRLFLAWRSVGQPAYWILGWIVDRSWGILKRPVYHVLTGVQANHVRPWFVLLPFGCPDGRQCSLGLSPHLDEIGTSWSWHTMSTSVVGLAPIKQLVCTLRLRSWYRWRCHRNTLWQIVKLFYQDLVNIALEYGRCVGQSKRHHLVLKMAIAGLKGRLPFIAFPDSHSMVGISQIELGETSSPT